MTKELKLKQSLELEVQLRPDAQHILICNYDDARQIATFARFIEQYIVVMQRISSTSPSTKGTRSKRS